MYAIRSYYAGMKSLQILKIGINQPQLNGKTTQLDWRFQAEFFHDFGPVCFYRANTNVQ